jgi:hypothetical protein
MALDEMMWHRDGHTINLKIVKSEIVIESVYCPEGDAGACHEPQYGCLVQWFLMRFGMECNVGSCRAESPMEVCWTLIGDPRDVESCQIWVMPVADEVFSAWLISLSLPAPQEEED